MIGSPDEVNVDLLMASASSILLHGYDEASQEARALMQNAVQSGRLRVVIDLPPLEIHVLVMDARNEHQQLAITITDDRDKWLGWLQSLFAPAQIQ
ncbi:MAG: hypothetical protein LAP86_27920 [Acidobacteriia bacterium]|nr:hypothetical protein [Terriglobia bacterium]